MTLSPEEFCSRVAAMFPASSPKLTTFPSGAFMIDVKIGHEIHVVEFLPSFKLIGVSRMSTATFGWEGVENCFDNLVAVEEYVTGLLHTEAAK